MSKYKSRRGKDWEEKERLVTNCGNIWAKSESYRRSLMNDRAERKRVELGESNAIVFREFRVSLKRRSTAIFALRVPQQLTDGN